MVLEHYHHRTRYPMKEIITSSAVIVFPHECLFARSSRLESGLSPKGNSIGKLLLRTEHRIAASYVDRNLRAPVIVYHAPLGSG